MMMMMLTMMMAMVIFFTLKQGTSFGSHSESNLYILETRALAHSPTTRIALRKSFRFFLAFIIFCAFTRNRRRFAMAFMVWRALGSCTTVLNGKTLRC